MFKQFRYFELGYILLALGFILLLQWPSWLQQPVHWLEQRLLSAGYSLSAPPSTPIKIAVAEIPADLLSEFTRNPVDHPLTQKLMELHGAGTRFHVFLPSTFGIVGFTQGEEFQAIADSLGANDAVNASQQTTTLLTRLGDLQRWKDFADSSDIFGFYLGGNCSKVAVVH